MRWVRGGFGGQIQTPRAHDERIPPPPPNRHKVEPALAILMLLMRLASPVRLRPTMEKEFLDDQTRISRFVDKALTHVFHRLAYTLAFDQRRLHNDIPYMARRIAATIGVDPDLFRVWGFVDGTFRRIARPSEGYVDGGGVQGWVDGWSLHAHVLMPSPTP